MVELGPAVSHVYWAIACCFSALAAFQVFVILHPPEPKPIFVNVIRPAGLHVPIRECKWILNQQRKSTQTQLGTN